MSSISIGTLLNEENGYDQATINAVLVKHIVAIKKDVMEKDHKIMLTASKLHKVSKQVEDNFVEEPIVSYAL